jgi:hypothetical protein
MIPFKDRLSRKETGMTTPTSVDEYLAAIPEGERNDPLHDRQAPPFRTREEDPEGAHRGERGTHTALIPRSAG